MRGQVPGLILEDKHASVAVHVRGVEASRREQALVLADEQAAEWVISGRLRRLTGNLVLEFLPNVACHKGDATRWIARDVEERTGDVSWVVFVGDDVTDEDAFSAIERGDQCPRRVARERGYLPARQYSRRSTRCWRG